MREISAFVNPKKLAKSLATLIKEGFVFKAFVYCVFANVALGLLGIRLANPLELIGGGGIIIF